MSRSDDTSPQPDRSRRRLRTLVGWAVVVALFYFIGRSLAANWEELAEADLHFDLRLLVASMALLALWMLGQALVWHLLTITSGVGIPLPKALGAWFYSQLGKYIPGKVFLYLGRLHFYVQEGRRVGPVTVAFGVETIGNFAAAIFMVLLAVLTANIEALDRYRWLLFLALVALLVALHPKLIDWLVRLAARVLRRQPFQVTLTYWQLLRYVGLYVLNWLLFGIALYVFIRSFYSLELSSILYLAGAFSFAAMVGIIAVFAPSGLGVREVILALFLGQIMPSSVALVMSAASRIWLTVVELAAAGVVYLLIRFRWKELSETTRPGSAPMTLDGGVEGDV